MNVPQSPPPLAKTVLKSTVDISSACHSQAILSDCDEQKVERKYFSFEMQIKRSLTQLKEENCLILQDNKLQSIVVDQEINLDNQMSVDENKEVCVDEMKSNGHHDHRHSNRSDLQEQKQLHKNHNFINPPQTSMLRQKRIIKNNIQQNKKNHVTFSIFKVNQHSSTNQRANQIKLRLFVQQKTREQLDKQNVCLYHFFIIVYLQNLKQCFEAFLVIIEIALLLVITILAGMQLMQFMNDCSEDFGVEVFILQTITFVVALVTKLLPQLKRCLLHTIARKVRIVYVNTLSLLVSLHFTMFLLPVTLYYKRSSSSSSSSQQCVLSMNPGTQERLIILSYSILTIYCIFSILFIVLLAIRKSNISQISLQKQQAIFFAFNQIFVIIQLLLLLGGVVTMIFQFLNQDRLKLYNFIELAWMVVIGLIILVRLITRWAVKRQRIKRNKTLEMA